MSAENLDKLPPELIADAVRRAVESSLASRRPAETPANAPQWPLLPVRPRYTIAEFLQFHDEAFVVNAYVGLLQRKPDAAELARRLKSLHAGTTRVELLRELRFGAEGLARNVHVLGLSSPDSVRQLESRRALMAREIDARCGRKVRRLKEQVRDLTARLAALEQRYAQLENAPRKEPRSGLGLLHQQWETRSSSTDEPREDRRPLAS